MSIYQDGKYLESNPDWHAGDAPFKAGWIADILTRNGILPNHVVEIGCGSGEILVELKRRHQMASFDGYDISADAYAICRSKQSPGLSFHLQNLLETPAEPADVLLAIDVFEHVEDYMGFIRAVKSRATYKVFHVPLDLSVQGLLLGTGLPYARWKVGHLHYFCKDTALATLRDCGLEIISWNYTHGATDLPNRPVRTKILHFPRKVLRAINADFAVRLFGGSSMMVLTR